MHKKFEINRTEIKGDCQLGKKGKPTILTVICPYLCTIYAYVIDGLYVLTYKAHRQLAGLGPYYCPTA